MTKRILLLIITLICFTLFCLPSYAMAEPDAEETYPPLTEEGNMTVTDDIYQLIVEKITQTGEDGTEVIENKQFITVHTRSGAEFYIVIDRSRDSENVYFLNQVDDDDLFALLEANDSATPCTCAEKCAAGEVNTECAVCRMNMKSCTGKEIVREEPAAEPEPDKSDEKSNNMLPVVFVILLIGGGVAVYFLKFRKNKPKTSGATDLDDYDYGEEDEVEYEGDEENE